MKLFLSIVLFFWGLLVAFTQEYRISQLTIEDGLSHNAVTSIIKDEYGFMWFGTRGGLNRYDGYEFIHFKPGKDTEPGFLGTSIERLYNKSNGDILIGTKSGGYSLYNPESETFNPNNGNQNFNIERVIAFNQDLDGNTWIGTWEGGLWFQDSDSDSLSHFLGRQKIYVIEHTPNGTIWLGGANGLRYKKKGGEISSLNPVLNGEVTDIAVDQERECIWCVGWGCSLIKIDYNTLEQEVFELKNSGLESSSTYSIFKDNSGKLWIGTWSGGLFTFDPESEKFKPVELKTKEATSSYKQSEVILDIYQDDVGEIWLGTEKGVMRLTPKTTFSTYNHQFEGGIENLNVLCMVEDSHNDLWIGAFGGGIYRVRNNKVQKMKLRSDFSEINEEKIITKTFFQDANQDLWVSLNIGIYLIKEEVNNTISLIPLHHVFSSHELMPVRKVNDIFIDNDNMWLASQQQGLYFFKLENNKYKLQKKYNKLFIKGGIDASRISCLQVDSQGQMWAATFNGLYLYNENDSNFVLLDSLLVDSRMPLCNIVLCTHLDVNGNIWFGTPCSLNKIEHLGNNKYKLKCYTREDGLLDDYINFILNDDEGNLWISTNAGLSKFEIASGEFKNFDKSDGLIGIDFNERSGCKSRSGKLFFGGLSNLTYFNPDEIKDSKVNPKIVITDFKVLNKPVEVNSEGILKKNINEIEKITLGHRESEFSFEFSALDFKAPEHNQYAYKLEGYNDDFVFINNRRHISFSNLKPNNYTLYIKGTNSNGIWSTNQFKLEIEVKPAPWKTWYAAVGYMLIIFIIVFFISWLGISQEHLKNDLNIEILKREQEAELNEYRYKFFTNISHEIRTPLTLILSPIKELSSIDASSLSMEYVQRKIKVIHQNANRLLSIINQLLEFRKVQAGRMQLKAEQTNLKEFIQRITPGFEEITKNKNISFVQLFEGNEWDCFVDLEKLNIVVYNLLSNAIKFSGDPGKIILKLKAASDTICLKISNDGKGIPENEIDNIFERFYQVDNHGKPGSTGIGLSLVKSYIELHKAEITVDSPPGGLTSFTILFKKGKQHLSEEEIVESGWAKLENDLFQPTLQNEHTKPKLGNKKKSHSILVAEDNDEIRSYLVDLFLERYDVLEASNGKQAFSLAIEYKPSLVVSDVMMPLMDGFELCQRIKSNDIISHTPVVLLTAKGTAQDQLFGAKKGADAYLTKPFDPELLFEKVKTLITNKEKLVKQYAQKVIMGPKDIEIEPSEKQFLEALVRCIENHMGEDRFDSKVLASEMAMSSSTLFRKIKKLTQNSPAEFIKKIKIQRAAQLLRDTDLSVSEIAEQIGYLDIKSFRALFKREYEQTPLEYRSSKQA